MANAFTDVDKWDDDWFLALSPKMKCVWTFLCETVKGCGERKLSLRDVSFKIGEQVTRQEFDEVFSGRVIWLSEDLIWIPGTLSRMYKTLSPKVPAHTNIAKKIIRLTQGVQLHERGERALLRFIDFLQPIESEDPSQALVRAQSGPDLKSKEKGERVKRKSNSSFEEGEGETFKVEHLVEIWNERMSGVKSFKSKAMPLVDDLLPTQKRFRAAKERVVEKPDPDYWRRIVDFIAKDEFCRGRNDREWNADFTYLVRPDTHATIAEKIRARSPKPEIRTTLSVVESNPYAEDIPELSDEERRANAQRLREILKQTGINKGGEPA